MSGTSVRTIGETVAYRSSRRLKSTTAETWSSSILLVSGLIALHAGLGIVMHSWPIVASVHGWIVGLIAVVAGLVARPARVAMVGAYITGADVLWRMTGAAVPWEFAKYIIIVAFLVTLVRQRAEFVWRITPLLYFVLLIPSIVVLVADPTWDSAAIRNGVSFGMSGPLVLTISIWLLSQLVLTQTQIRSLFILCIAPIAGIAAVTLVSTYSAAAIHWTVESNFVTSGGFGPNQTSAALGLGALLAFLVSIQPDSSQIFGWMMKVCALLFLTQSAMTFSRGGMYAAIGAATLFSLAMLVGWRGKTREHMRGIGLLVGLGVVLTVTIIPRLDDFTGGTLKARLEETNLTGRSELIRDDVRLWSEHPLLGVGPGATRLYRTGRAAPSHTEYSRLLAEHGVFGAIAIVMLILMCTSRLLRARDTYERAMVSALLSWSALTMAHASMRTLAPGFIFGLAFATLLHIPRAGQLTHGLGRQEYRKNSRVS